MLKKLALVLLAVCCYAMAAQEKLYSIVVDNPAMFRLVGTYDGKTGDVLQAKEKSDVYVQIFAEKGFVVEKAYALYGEGKSIELELNDSEASKYHFAMPAADVTLKAEFKKKTSAITVEGCDGENVICGSYPKSATFGDSVKVFYKLAAEGFLSVSLVGDVSKYSLATEGEDEYVAFVMGSTDVAVEFLFEVKAEPTKFKLTLVGDFAKYGAFRTSSMANLDSANVGDIVDLVLNIPLRQSGSFEMQYWGLEKDAFKKVDDMSLYRFVMPKRDVKFDVSGTFAEDEPETKESVSEKVAYVEAKSYEVKIASDEYGEIKKYGESVKDQLNRSYEGQKVILVVHAKPGYVLDQLLAKTASGDNIDLKKSDDGYEFTMPASDVNVSATYKLDETEYEIKLTGCDGVDLKCESSKEKARYGEEFTVTVEAADGVIYEFESDSDLNCKNGEAEHSYVFTMVQRNTEIKFAIKEKKEKSSDEKSDPSDKLYKISVVTSDKGEIQRDLSIEDHPDEMIAGTTITLWVKPVAGYVLDALTIKDAEKNAVEWKKVESGYKFVMPESDIEISATYKSATYQINIACGDFKCEGPETAHYGDKITLKFNMNGKKSISIKHTAISDLEKKQDGSDLTITFTMPGNDVEFTLSSGDEESSDSKDSGDGKKDKKSDKKSDDGKGDKKSADSKSDKKSDDSKGDKKSDDGKSDDGKGDKKSDEGKSDKKSDDSKKDDDKLLAESSKVINPTFDVRIREHQIYVSGASAGSAYMIYGMDGKVIVRGYVGTPSFCVSVPNSGEFFLRIGKQVRPLNVK